MKKIFNLLMATAIAAFTFTACEDVPEPYNNPYSQQGPGTQEEVIEPSGTGTEADPYNVAAALEATATLAESESTGELYVKGIVTQVTELSTSYGNATYYISDTKSASNQLYVFRGKLLNNEPVATGKELKVGDEVTVFGTITNYKGTIEFAQGNYIVAYKAGEGGDEPAEPDAPGTAEQPLTVAEALAYIDGLDADIQSPEGYVKGKISAITEVSAQYGNATYFISDDGGTDVQLQVYRGLGLDGAKFTSESDIKVGDSVVICGKLVNYKGNTKQFAQSSKMVYLNGKGGETPSGNTVGTKDAPKTVAEALTAINGMEDKATSAEYWFVKGKVVKVTTNQENFEKYGNLNYLISEDGTENNTLTVYSGDGLNGEKFTGIDALKAGDEVIVYGQLQKYVNNSGKMTPEIAKGNYLVSLTPGGTQPTPPPSTGTGTFDSPLSASQAYAAVADMEADATSTEDYYVKGKVTSIKYTFSAQYGTATFNISDDGNASDKEFIVYSCYYFDNQPWAEGNTQIQVGDEVIVCGKVINYKGTTPEFASKKNWIVSLNGKTSESGETPEQPTTGTGSLSSPLSAAQAYDAVAAMDADQVSGEDYFVKGKVCSIKYTYSAQYGTATFNISDDGTEGSKQFIAYSCYYFNNQPWAEGNTQIQVGDEVIVCGKVINYKGTTPEFSSKKNWLVSLNGKTSDGNGENQGGGNEEGGAVSGNSITVEYGSMNITSLDNPLTLTDGTTLTFTQEDGNNKPVYHEGSKIIRMYARNAVTINAGSKKIDSVVFAYDTYNGTAYKGNDEMYGEAGGNQITPTKDDKNVTFANVNSSTLKVINAFSEKNSGGTQFRCTGLTINYAK